MKRLGFMSWKIGVTLSLILFLTLAVSVVRAPYSSLGSGYAIWTNYHGVNVPGGTPVTATAGTTEHPSSSAYPLRPDVTHVRFVWMAPEASESPDLYSPPLADPPMALAWDGSTLYNGWPVYAANDTQVVTDLGDWGIQAWFYDTNGSLRHESGVEQIRAVSFNVVPEVPLLGTAGAAVVMLLGLALFLRRKRNTPALTAPNVR